jgi:hypothetical protein
LLEPATENVAFAELPFEEPDCVRRGAIRKS